METLKYFSNGTKKKVLLDLRGAHGAEQEARNYVAKEGKPYIQAMALIVKSPYTRMLGNFFIGFSKPNYPSKIFNNEEKAIQWLKEFD